jgi:acetylornithine deacetylase
MTVTGTIMLDMPAFETKADSVVPTTAQQVMESLGRQSPLTGWTAACEGGFVAQATHAPTIILGPGDINNQAHQPDESVRVDDLLLAAQAYALVALRLNHTSSETH